MLKEQPRIDLRFNNFKGVEFALASRLQRVCQPEERKDSNCIKIVCVLVPCQRTIVFAELESIRWLSLLCTARCANHKCVRRAVFY